MKRDTRVADCWEQPLKGYQPLDVLLKNYPHAKNRNGMLTKERYVALILRSLFEDR